MKQKSDEVNGTKEFPKYAKIFIRENKAKENETTIHICIKRQIILRVP